MDWALDPTVTFLNHGSFGACPRAVLEFQARLRAELEAQPVRFLIRELEGRLDATETQVLVVPVDRATSVDRHRDVWRAVAAAIGSAA